MINKTLMLWISQKIEFFYIYRAEGNMREQEGETQIRICYQEYQGSGNEEIMKWSGVYGQIPQAPVHTGLQRAKWSRELSQPECKS